MDFIRELCRLSEFCNFSNTLNDRRHDQLMFGIQDEKTQIQQNLLDSADLTS